MAFLETSDLYKRIKQDELEAITEGESGITALAISETIAYVKAFLAARYDTTAIFNKTGTSRDQFILGLCIDIAVYKISATALAGIDLSDRLARNDIAIETLKGIQKQEINPDLPISEDNDGNDSKAYIVAGGNTSRESYY